MPSVTKFAGTGGVGASASVNWTNPGNILARDTTYARLASPSGTEANNQTLIPTNFGFAIPTGATIVGITVLSRISNSIQVFGGASNQIGWRRMTLTKDGSAGVG